MAGDLVPQTIGYVEDRRSQARAGVPFKDYRWEREQQRTTQRATLERLRYRVYVRRGTLGGVMMAMRRFYRSNYWYVTWLVYAYMLYRFAR